VLPPSSSQVYSDTNTKVLFIHCALQLQYAAHPCSSQDTKRHSRNKAMEKSRARTTIRCSPIVNLRDVEGDRWRYSTMPHSIAVCLVFEEGIYIIQPLDIASAKPSQLRVNHVRGQACKAGSHRIYDKSMGVGILRQLFGA